MTASTTDRPVLSLVKPDAGPDLVQMLKVNSVSDVLAWCHEHGDMRSRNSLYMLRRNAGLTDPRRARAVGVTIPAEWRVKRKHLRLQAAENLRTLELILRGQDVSDARRQAMAAMLRYLDKHAQCITYDPVEGFSYADRRYIVLFTNHDGEEIKQWIDEWVKDPTVLD